MTKLNTLGIHLPCRLFLRPNGYFHDWTVFSTSERFFVIFSYSFVFCNCCQSPMFSSILAPPKHFSLTLPILIGEHSDESKTKIQRISIAALSVGSAVAVKQPLSEHNSARWSLHHTPLKKLLGSKWTLKPELPGAFYVPHEKTYGTLAPNQIATPYLYETKTQAAHILSGNAFRQQLRTHSPL